MKRIISEEEPSEACIWEYNISSIKEYHFWAIVCVVFHFIFAIPIID